MTNIIVAFSNENDAVNIKNLLVRHGYSVVTTTTNAARILALADEMSDGIVVCGYRLTDMQCVTLRELLPSSLEMLLVASPTKISEVYCQGIVAVAMPLKTNDLLNTLEMLSQGVARRRKKQREQPTVRNESQKSIIDEAKKVLMDKNNMSESEAHRYIQKTSMDSGNNMVETAQMIMDIMLS